MSHRGSPPGPGDCDALVIGGGFFGCAIAEYLAARRGLTKVVLAEQEGCLFQRASYRNQARVHNGYHYPRSFTTAYRSRVNFLRFARDWPTAVYRDFVQLYAIVRRGSQVSARHFERFCADVGAPMRTAEPAHQALFDPRLVEAVWAVEENAFNATELARLAREGLDRAGVDVRLRARVNGLAPLADGGLAVRLETPEGLAEGVKARWVVNCAYSGLNQVAADWPGTRTGLKHEIAEVVLVRPPESLRGVGVTVMDGPFFSMMPFPARGLHSFTHVRYTPHLHWTDRPGMDPYGRLAAYHRESRVERMRRDAARYLPAIAEAEYVESLFEVKTVLQKNETDDGRPILFETHATLPGCYSVLGGKIDNIYDVLEKLDAEPFDHRMRP